MFCSQKLLSDSEAEDDDIDSDEADREFIESLPENRKKLLYKMLNDAEKSEKLSKMKKKASEKGAKTTPTGEAEASKQEEETS